MKKYVITFIFFTCFNQSIFAQDAPLRVAIPAFAPPFVMQDSLNQYYGFDIATMESICRTLKRRCKYLPMNADDLIPALATQQADVAIGGIVYIFPHNRPARFSTPYMISKAQFITTDKAIFTTPFTLKQLSEKRMGVLKESPFEAVVSKIRTNKPRIITFERDNDMIEALRANTIDIALLSELEANYWQIHSNNLLKNIGQPFPIGLGFSIATAPGNPLLLRQLNHAIIQYQESKDYIRNYKLYIPESF
ncbi:MAG: transporter substrate-binding domain-containing protein [Legionella sp.]|nr:transporter substrate-binding domain-containing protein [Legionella sp.]